jgi:hypothetical protein
VLFASADSTANGYVTLQQLQLQLHANCMLVKHNSALYLFHCLLDSVCL